MKTSCSCGLHIEVEKFRVRIFKIHWENLRQSHPSEMVYHFILMRIGVFYFSVALCSPVTGFLLILKIKINTCNSPDRSSIRQ